MALYLTQSLHRAVQSQPERVATICGARQHSYRQYAERVARFAGALAALGMARGDRIGILAHNSDRYLEAFYGTWWAGGAVNPVNYRWSAAEIAYSLDDCDTRILLIDEALKDLVPELQSRSRCLKALIYIGDGATPAGMHSYEDLLAAASPAADAGGGGNDLAGVMYTGGTTGFPKGVMLSHENLASNALACVAHRLVECSTRALIIAPMFHIAAGLILHGTAQAGGTWVIVPQFTPSAALQAIEQQRVTHTLLVPTMIQMAVDHADAARYDLGSVHTVAYGGSVISEAVLRRAMARFPNAGFHQLYGMTELAPMATCLDADDHRAGVHRPALLRSAGRATHITEVRVIDAEGREVPHNTVGEVAIRGPGVMLGYWGRPEDTERALQGGWLHSGDGGCMDEAGYLYIVDRLKDMIISGGENIYSAEVENAVAGHAAIAACAVIGIPSEQWGESVHAVVVLRAGTSVTAAQLITHCHGLIAGYKCPRSVEFRDSLPVTGAGKVQKTELRKPYWDGRQRNVS
jgi:acyl-CoA synthetase (AMP-forming)/AMP-acid ligase II